MFKHCFINLLFSQIAFKRMSPSTIIVNAIIIGTLNALRYKHAVQIVRSGCPVLAVSATDTPVSVSGSGRLQSADGASLPDRAGREGAAVNGKGWASCDGNVKQAGQHHSGCSAPTVAKPEESPYYRWAAAVVPAGYDHMRNFTYKGGCKCNPNHEQCNPNKKIYMKTTGKTKHIQTGKMEENVKSQNIFTWVDYCNHLNSVLNTCSILCVSMITEVRRNLFIWWYL